MTPRMTEAEEYEITRAAREAAWRELRWALCQEQDRAKRVAK